MIALRRSGMRRRSSRRAGVPCRWPAGVRWAGRRAGPPRRAPWCSPWVYITIIRQVTQPRNTDVTAGAGAPAHGPIGAGQRSAGGRPPRAAGGPLVRRPAVRDQREPGPGGAEPMVAAGEATSRVRPLPPGRPPADAPGPPTGQPSGPAVLGRRMVAGRGHETGRTAEVRAARRRALACPAGRAARGGVAAARQPRGLRPAPDAPSALHGAAGGPAGAGARLWDLDGWAGQAAAPGPWRVAPDGPAALAPGFVLSAAALRHLQADPLLPPGLPAHWPGARCARLRRLGRPLPDDAAGCRGAGPAQRPAR